MNRAEQAQQAELFRNKHRGPRLLLLPNAWDALSARVFVAAGFDAIATTSGGVAWSLGYADGEQAPWDEVVAATARIVSAARVPVTADIEAGYGETPDEVMRSVAEIIKAGAVGVNLEDGTLRGPVPIRSLVDAADRIRAAREAARAAVVPIVINARTDLYLRNIGDEASRFDETVERGRAYLAAGADCVYPITLRDLDNRTSGESARGTGQHQCARRPAERRGARSTRRRARQHRQPGGADGDVDNTADRRRSARDRAVRQFGASNGAGGRAAPVYRALVRWRASAVFRRANCRPISPRSTSGSSGRMVHSAIRLQCSRMSRPRCAI
jgi:hypothetical protein